MTDRTLDECRPRNIIFQVFREAAANFSRAVRMKQGIIPLRPKPGEDSQLSDNYRPISLLNYVSKLLTYIYSNRFKGGLDQMMNETQTGFVSNSSRHHHIRLVQELFHSSQVMKDKGFNLFLDFCKAFDMLSLDVDFI